MDRSQWIQKRRGKYLAQVLEHFERHIEHHLPDAAAGDVDDFKGLVRARMNALATDCVDLMELGARAEQRNLLGDEIRDALHPTGHP